MRTSSWYSSLPKRARPNPLSFCTGGHGWKNSVRLRVLDPFPTSRMPQAGFTHRSRVPGPTAAPANSVQQHPQSPSAGLRSTLRQPAIPHSHALTSTETPAAARWVALTAPLWFHGPVVSCSALPPSAFPAWHRSATTSPVRINPIPRAALGATAIRQSAPAPRQRAQDHWSFAAPRPQPPPAVPTAARPALPESIARAARNEFRSEMRTSPNSGSAAGDNIPTPRLSLVVPLRSSPNPGARPPAAFADNSSGSPACRECSSSPDGGKNTPGNRQSPDREPAQRRHGFLSSPPAGGSA